MNTFCAPLALNAISSLTVNSTDPDHVEHSLLLKRTDALPNLIAMPALPEVDDITEEELREFNDNWMPPPREPSKLPPPGNVHLAISLGDIIDAGATSIVYDVIILDEELRARLPPLVAKIARPSRRGRLEREKFWYDYLESLQGVVLARCYGWFESEGTPSVPAGFWAPDKSKGGSDGYDTSDTEVGSVTSQSHSVCAVDVVVSHRDDHSEQFTPPHSHDQAREESPRRLVWMEEVSLDDPAGPSSRVSILLLEKLGGKLPVGQTLGDIKGDIFGIGRNFGPFRVEMQDVRWSNILKAPEGPGSLPSLPSPHTGATYGWRVIDLESVDYLAGPPNTVAYAWIMMADRVLDSLPYGRIMEPWETE